MDTAREEDLQPGCGRRVGLGQEVLQDGELGLPQREGGAGSDVPAALGALEHEPAGTGGPGLP